MLLRQIGEAVGLFTVTNVDDLVVMVLFFAQVSGGRHGIARVVIGQYLGFVAIVAIAVGGALGLRLVPEPVIPCLGLLPLALGLGAAGRAWRERRTRDADPAEVDRAPRAPATAIGVASVATVTFANGGDNIAVYLPVFAITGTAGLIVYIVTFLVLVAVWCAAALFFTTRPRIAEALARWGNVLLPVVLISLGLVILIEGGAFGL